MSKERELLAQPEQEQEQGPVACKTITVNMTEAAHELGLSKQRLSTAWHVGKDLAWHVGKDLDRPKPVRSIVNVKFYQLEQVLSWYQRFQNRPLEIGGRKKPPVATFDNEMARAFICTR
jgi:hypothetical protein